MINKIPGSWFGQWYGQYEILFNTNQACKIYLWRHGLNWTDQWIIFYKFFLGFLIVQVHFLKLNLIALFPFLIKYYHIMFIIIIVFWLGSDRPSGHVFFLFRFTSFNTHASLLTFFDYFFTLFRHCCSHSRVLGKILMHEFPISYSYTAWSIFFHSVKAMTNWKRCAIKQIQLN